MIHDYRHYDGKIKIVNTEVLKLMDWGKSKQIDKP
jgi:hypothetical protein